jgi:hypothetical protein
MVDKLDRLEESGAYNSEKLADILVALSLLRERVAAKTVLKEHYLFDDFGVNSYLPFMNFLQSREYESVRRFVLVDPSPIVGHQWGTAGNGVWYQEVLTDNRSKFTFLTNLTITSKLGNDCCSIL